MSNILDYLAKCQFIGISAASLIHPFFANAQTRRNDTSMISPSRRPGVY